MRAMDCSDPGTHEDVHFSAEHDEALFAQVQKHRDECHSDVTDAEIKQMISTDAYDE